jgi:hypothetical protein
VPKLRAEWWHSGSGLIVTQFGVTQLDRDAFRRTGFLARRDGLERPSYNQLRNSYLSLD